jgi:DNA-binding ferritin-like protein
MFTNIGLNDFQRHGPTTILSTLLADQCVLSMKARKYHWNVVGSAVQGPARFL